MIWSPEQEALRDSARTFVQRELLPHLQAWEETRSLPLDLHLKAAKQGLLGVSCPEEVGGSGGGLLDSVAVTEAVIVAGELIGALAITEPEGGSDVARIRTTALREGDHYVVNGAKTFISSGVRADFVTTAVRTGGPGHQGISLLVVEKGTPGFGVTRQLEKMGWHCSDTSELSYTDVPVPVEDLVGEEGSGFAQIATAFVIERVGLVVQGYATAERCLRLALEHVRSRVTFGEPLIRRQLVRHKLVEALHAKKLGVDAASYCMDEAVQLHGGTGSMNGTEVERHYRDARLLGIGGGANEVLDDLSAKLLGFTS